MPNNEDELDRPPETDETIREPSATTSMPSGVSITGPEPMFEPENKVRSPVDTVHAIESLIAHQ